MATSSGLKISHVLSLFLRAEIYGQYARGRGVAGQSKALLWGERVQ